MNGNNTAICIYNICSICSPVACRPRVQWTHWTVLTMVGCRMRLRKNNMIINEQRTQKEACCRQFCGVGVPGSVLVRLDVDVRSSVARVSCEACCRKNVFSNWRRVLSAISSVMRALRPFTSSRTANIRWLFTSSCITHQPPATVTF